MKWTRGAVRLVTASGTAVLVAGGLGLVARSEPGEASFVGSAPVPSATAPAPASPVTPTSRPTPTKVPTKAARKPARAPRHRAAPTVWVAPTPSEHSVQPTPSAPATPPTLDFTLSSFNVLGSSHTSGTGGKGKKAGMAPGGVRARWTAQLIRRHGADVVGFQELQSNQLEILRRNTNLEFFPGSSMRRADSENSIAWRRDRWAAVETRTVAVPYFNGNKRQMPYVRLRNLATGLEAWFANFHNPADTRRFPGQAKFRSRAIDIEIALANRLTSRTDTPVFFTGDMNERDAYFCRLTGGAPMVAARGGSNNGVCRPDDPRAVDWIFGSQGVLFTDYLEDRSDLVRRASDHPMLVARVSLGGRSIDLSSLPGAASSD